RSGPPGLLEEYGPPLHSGHPPASGGLHARSGACRRGRTMRAGEGLMAKARAAAAANADRSRIPPSSIAIHLCIGSVYAWSIYSPALTRVLGVVAPAADDWSLRDVTWVFSVAIVFLGLSAAFAGRWVEAVGPRRAGIVAALCWGGGHL